MSIWFFFGVKHKEMNAQKKCIKIIFLITDWICCFFKKTVLEGDIKSFPNIVLACKKPTKNIFEHPFRIFMALIF